MRIAGRTVGFALLVTVLMATFASCGKQAALQADTGVAIAGSLPAEPQQVMSLPGFTGLVRREGPAVVNISTTRRLKPVDSPFADLPDGGMEDPLLEFFRRFAPGDQWQREYQTQSLGSGFIISADGYIMSNAHVVEDAEEIRVRLTDKREFKAKLVGLDQRSDIALLKIQASGLPVVKIGDSSRVEVGEWVVAIGAPFGFSNTVSQGIVSAIGRSLPGGDVVPFIQTDVPINPGNSGGPLFNLNGEVIGINSQIYSRSGGYMGLSFAIPVDMAMKVKDELLSHGTVRRGWLGVSVQDVSADHARSFSLDRVTGALVASVEPGSPAEKDGLQIGDIILKLGGKEIGSAGELVRAVSDSAPGLKVRLQVWREGKTKEIPVMPSDASAVKSAGRMGRIREDEVLLGMSMHELSRGEQAMLGTEAYLLVEKVKGIAARSGILTGDLVIAVNNRHVRSIRQLRAELERVGKRAALLVKRGETSLFMPLNY